MTANDTEKPLGLNPSEAAAGWRFFGLLIVLSGPFYMLGAAGGRLPLPVALPTSALMAILPMAAALILVAHAHGLVDAARWLGQNGDPRRIRRPGWVLVAVLFMPVLCVMAFAIQQIAGADLPLPQIAPGLAMLLFAAFLVGAVGEELGWQGYAYPALRSGQSAFGAALVIGVIWALWHLIPFIQLGRSTWWIVWHLLGTVALRVIIVWLHENAGQSVPVAVLFHTMLNLSWALFPIDGSFYDPFVAFVILAPVVVLIVGLWGWKTLHQFGTSVRRRS